MKGLRASRAVGAKAMRCFLGSMSERRGKLPLEAHIDATRKVFKAVRTQALDTGVKIALENHNGDLSAAEVRTLVEECGKDLLGVNLDTGNPMWLLEDPMQTLETLAPYVVTSHFRDSAIWENENGICFQWVALGDGNVNLAAVAARFHELCPQSPMQLEIITGRQPQFLPCYSGGAEFWNAYPKVSGTQFARFSALAKRGRPFTGPMGDDIHRQAAARIRRGAHAAAAARSGTQSRIREVQTERRCAMQKLALLSFAVAAFGGEIARVDHYVGVKSTVPAMAGQIAQLYVREVVQTDLALRGKARGVVLFVHGAGTPASVAYDVHHSDYSWMRHLAQAGYDVFAMDQTGYGGSTRPAPMNDPCNLAADLQKLIGISCAPSYPHVLTNMSSDWNDIDGVVNYPAHAPPRR